MERLWCAGRTKDKHDADASNGEVAAWCVDERQPAHSSSQTGSTVVPEVNTDLLGMLSFTLVVRRRSCGFGFTVFGSSPVQVCRIDHESPAAEAGLMMNDFIVRINGQNVSRSTAESVARLVRDSERQIVLEIQRVSSSPHSDLRHVLSSSRGPCVDERPRRSTTRQPFASIGNLSHSNHQQRRLNALPASGTHSTDCATSPAGVLRRTTTVNLHTANASTSDSSERTSSDKDGGQLTADSGRQTASDVASSRRHPLYNDNDDDDLPAQTPNGDDVRMTSRVSAMRRLAACEKQFVVQMQTGVSRYVIALRRADVISRTDHDTLFINLETILSLAEERLTSLSDCNTTATPAAAAAASCQLSAVYRRKLEELCDAYETYCSGVRDSIRLLVELKRTATFADFLNSSQSPTLTLSSFIKKPLEHIKDLVVGLQKIVSYTAQDHADYDNLRHVLQSVRNCCNRINEQNLYSSSLSLASTSRDTVMPSSSWSSSSSPTSSVTSRRSAACVSGSVAASNCSSVISSIDTELLDVQRRLVFPKHIPVFQLATASHHLIYSGSLMLAETRQLTPIFAVLMSDLLLLTRPDPESSSLVVLAEPLSLQHIVGSSFHCSHPCEFQLSIETQVTSLQEAWQPHSLLLRAPSVELKCTWKNILEQRILTCKAQRQQLVESRSVDNIV